LINSTYLTYSSEIGLNGELDTIHRWHPGGISYFLLNGMVIRDIAAGVRHAMALDCKEKNY
jgi:hypothetical protein